MISKKLICFSLIFTLLFSNCSIFASENENSNIQEYGLDIPQEDFKTDSYIIKYKNKKTKRSFSFRNTSKIKKIKNLNVSESKIEDVEIVTFDEEVSLQESKNILNLDNSDIEYIQPDYTFELSSIDISYNKDEENSFDIINNEVIENANIDNSNEIIIAVIDSKIDTENNKFKNNLWTNIDEIQNGIDVDNNGYIDDIHGYDFIKLDEEMNEFDKDMEMYHGTHIAGIITGNSNVSSVHSEYFSNIKIMPLTVFKNSLAKTSDIIEAIEYAKQNGAKIINISFGGGQENPALEEIIKNSPDILFVCAAGNFRRSIDEKPIYPASYNLPNVISVTSANKDGGLSYYSNYGENSVDIAALGKEIESTSPNNLEAIKSGTSMATALVTHAAGIIFVKNGWNSPENIKKILIDSADKISPLSGYVKNSAFLNIDDAINNEVKDEIVNKDFKDEFSISSEIMSDDENMQLFAASKTIKISAGRYHSLALKEDGTVWAWGKGGYGELGNGETSGSNIPVQVKGLTNIVEISAGNMFSMALKRDGTVWTWGLNEYGQLGTGNTFPYWTVPVQVNIPKQSANSTVKAISAGYNHGLVMLSDMLVSFGENSYNQLGDETVKSRRIPGPVKGFDKSDNQKVTHITTTSAGNYIIKEHDSSSGGGSNINKDLVGWGAHISTNPKVLGYTYNNESDIIKLVSSSYHSVILRKNGKLLVSGDNKYGQLGTKNTVSNYESFQEVSILNNLKDVSAGDWYTLGLTNDGSVYSWGLRFYDSNYMETGENAISDYEPIKINLKNIKEIAAGFNFALFLDESGQIWSLGENNFGQLGTGNTKNSSIPVKVFDSAGAFESKMINVSAGYGHSAALKEDGTVWTWGDNSYGQLGNNSNEISEFPVKVNGLSNIKDVQAGNGFTVALGQNGRMWAWGKNDKGQLGIGASGNRNTPVGVAGISVQIDKISVGYEHIIAIGKDKSVWVWGVNSSGQLGDGTTVNKTSPVKIPVFNAVNISAGKFHSMLLDSNGTVWTWGSNSYGQLGRTGNTSKPASAIGGMSQISAGAYHSMALSSDTKEVYTCGYNSNGELALGTKTNQRTMIKVPGLKNLLGIEAGNGSSFAIGRKLYFWGNDNGQLNIEDFSTLSTNKDIKAIYTSKNTIEKISSSELHQLVIKSDGTTWAYGNNEYGQLGIGNHEDQEAFIPVMFGGGDSLHPSKGTGTATNPYLIYDVYDLFKVSNDLTACYKLMNDINLANTPKSPIGTQKYPFKGTFDGSNFKISNLKINLPNKDNVGLFGYTSKANIRNLNIVNIDIIGKTNVGALIGSMYNGYAQNCSASSIIKVKDIKGDKELIGYTSGATSIIDCTFNNLSWNQKSFKKSIQINKGNNYKYMLTVTNIPSVDIPVYIIKYDSSKIKIKSIGIAQDISANVTGSTILTDSDIQILSNKSGEIQFKVKRTDKNWNGILTSLNFTALINGNTEITFEARDF